MYKKLAVLVLFLFPIYRLHAYNIVITIKGAPNTKYFLGYYYGDKQYIKDSAVTDASGRMIFTERDSFAMVPTGKKIASKDSLGQTVMVPELKQKTFKRKEQLQGGIYLIASVNRELLFDFVVTEQSFSLETDTLDYSGHMKVKGSLENSAFFEYSAFTSIIAKEISPLDAAYKKAKEDKDTVLARSLREQISRIESRLNDYRDSVSKANPNLLIGKIFNMMKDITIPEAPVLPNGKKDSLFAYNYYRYHYFDNFDFSDDRISYTPVFHSKVEYFMTKVTPQIPDSINKAIDYLMSLAVKSRENSKWCIYWITNHYETSPYMGMDKVFVHMVNRFYRDPKITYWVDDALRARIIKSAEDKENNLIGLKAPELNMPDTAFTMRSLHGIRAKYTMVLFWDATCGRCKEEIPRLKALYDKLNKEQYLKGLYFEVYAVSLTADGEEWKKFVRENKLKWINVSDLYNNTKFRKLYDVYSTPVIYLLNEEKKIIAKRLSVEQVGEFIERGIE